MRTREIQLRCMAWIAALLALGTLLVEPTPAWGAGRTKAASEKFRKLWDEGKVREALEAGLEMKNSAVDEFGSDSPKVIQATLLLAEFEAESGQFGKARGAVAEAAKAMGKKGDPKIVPELNVVRGWVYQCVREFEQAEKFLQEAVEKSGESPRPDRTTVRAMTEMAWLRIRQRDYAPARELTEKALEILIGTDKADARIRARTLAARAVALSYSPSRAEQEQATEVFDKAIEAVEEGYCKGHYLTALVRLNRADHWFRNGRSGEALESRLALVEEIGTKLGKEQAFYANALDDVGDSFRQQRDLAQAEKSYQEALRIRSSVFGKGSADTMQSELNLGYVALGKEELREADTRFQTAIKIAVEKMGKLSLDMAEAALAYGTYQSKRGDLETALSNLRAAADIFTSKFSATHDQALLARHTMAEVYMRKKDVAQALRILEADLTAIETQGATTASAYDLILETIGLVRAIERKFPEARSAWEKALELRTKRLGEDDPSVVLLASYLARLKGLSGDWHDAMLDVRSNRRAIDAHLARVLSGLTESEQIAYLEDQERPIYHYSMSLAVEAMAFDESYAEEAASWVLNGKGMANRVLSQFFESVRASNSADARKKIRELMMTRGQLAAMVCNLLLRDRAIRNPNDLINLVNDITKRIPDLAKKERTMARDMAIALRAKDTKPKWTNVAEVRARLPQDTVLIEFVRFLSLPFVRNAESQPGEVYYAIVIPPAGKGPVVWRSLGPAGIVDANVISANARCRMLVTRAEASQRISIAEHERITQSALADLSKALFTPILGDINGYEHWIVSPDSLLYQTPWPALVDQDQKYLIETRTITTVLSGRMLTQANSKIDWKSLPPPQMFTEIDYGKSKDGDDSVTPLPNAKREADGVAPLMKRLVGREPEVYRRAKATEGAADKLSGPSIAMFSTHGYALNSGGKKLRLPFHVSPLMLTGLCMANANAGRGQSSGNDGYMTGLEICGLNLEGTKLVVLSACQTAEGEVNDGEGVASLQLAFHLAGAESVASTLWSVPDAETADLMISFFRHLADGKKAPPLAMAEAQREFLTTQRARGKPTHPMLWAAFLVDSVNPAHH